MSRRHEDHAPSASPLQRTFAVPAVLEFYRTLPFNYRDRVEEHAKVMAGDNVIAGYPCLSPFLSRGARVLDVGCGVGWLAMSVAHHFGARVTGIDFNPVVIERAREIAAELELDVAFEVRDFFLFAPPDPFDVVVSLGVLHHTDDCHAGLRHLCRRMVRPGGHVMVGLYHAHGRKPFIEHFRAMKHAGATEEEMLTRYRTLHSWLSDETHIRSWFRDQVFHPHETQHTLAEVVPILESVGMTLVATSINRFQPFGSLDELFEREKTYEDLARQRLEAGQYFPGFFVFLAKRVA